MKTIRQYIFIVLCAGLLIALGCEIAESERGSSADNEGEDAIETLDFSTITWLGPAYPEVQRDDRAVLQAVSIERDANIMELTYNSLPEDWPKLANAVAQLIMFEDLGDGLWRGGRVAWIATEQTFVSLHNVSTGLNDWTQPPAGTRMAIMLVSTDDTLRTNIAVDSY